jgi:hypothetical protein
LARSLFYSVINTEVSADLSPLPRYAAMKVAAILTRNLSALVSQEPSSSQGGLLASQQAHSLNTDHAHKALSDAELDAVSGGMVIVKLLDAPSPKLYSDPGPMPTPPKH